MPLYNKPQYYDADNRDFLEQESLNINKLITINNIDSVIEIGCGTGRIILPLIGKVSNITGIDNNTKMLNTLKSKLSTLPYSKLSKVKLVEKDIRAELNIDKADLVLCSFNFMHHFSKNEDWLAIMKNITKMVKPNGFIMLDMTINKNKSSKYKKDIEIPYENGTLIREQYLLYEDKHQVKKMMLYIERDSQDKVLNKTQLNITFAKIKWGVLSYSTSINGLKVKKVTIGYDGKLPSNKVLVYFEKNKFPYRLNEIEPSSYPEIIKLSNESGFLPKVTWTESSSMMMINGLMSSKWKGWGLFDKEGLLKSYIDFKEHSNGEIEIGFCMTYYNDRGKGLMTHLLSLLILKYFDRNFSIGTYKSNSSMIHIIKKFSFLVKEVENDRENGEQSIYYQRESYSEFIDDLNG